MMTCYMAATKKKNSHLVQNDPTQQKKSNKLRCSLQRFSHLVSFHVLHFLYDLGVHHDPIFQTLHSYFPHPFRSNMLDNLKLNILSLLSILCSDESKMKAFSNIIQGV